MPRKIDEGLRARAVRLVQDHRAEYSSLTAAAAVGAKQLGRRQGVGSPLGDPG
jgi:transposase